MDINTKWFGKPMIVGWEVLGLYQHDMDGTDINCVSSTQHSIGGKGYVACGDDFGMVRLFTYPALSAPAHKSFSGHAEFVIGTEFTHDDKRVVSIGGADRSIFVWQLVDPLKEYLPTFMQR